MNVVFGCHHTLCLSPGYPANYSPLFQPSVDCGRLVSSPRYLWGENGTARLFEAWSASTTFEALQHFGRGLLVSDYTGRVLEISNRRWVTSFRLFLSFTRRIFSPS